MIASLLYPQVKASRANEFMIMNPPTETSVAPDEVEGVDAADAAVAVPELDLQAFGWAGDVEVEQVAVTLDEDAVGAGDGDF